MKKTLSILFLSVLFSPIISYNQGTVFDLDSNQYQTVIIDGNEWINSNLSVSHYKNGDPIQHAITEEEWKECAEKKIGCWCYFQNDSTNSFAQELKLTQAAQEPNSFGKLYNWYAVNDPRGMGIEGYRIPTNEDWNSLINYGSKALKSETGWQILVNLKYAGCDCIGYNCNGNNSTGFNAKGSGYRNYIGIWDDYASFYEGFVRAVYWTDFNLENTTRDVICQGDTRTIETGAMVFGIDAYENDQFWEAKPTGFFAKGDGYSVRLIKE
ncbi:MAG: FISUMP domain-containing protein [Crocinitomicaceae bacterium]